jgi:hypothetical protein
MHLDLLAQLVQLELLVLPGQLALQATLEPLALLARLGRQVTLALQAYRVFRVFKV